MKKSSPTALQQLDARLHEQQQEVAYLRVALDLQMYRIAQHERSRHHRLRLPLLPRRRLSF